MIPYLPHILPLSAIRSNWIIMDDKRTFLAIALAIAVLLAWTPLAEHMGWIQPQQRPAATQEAIEAYCRDWDASGISKSLTFAQKVNGAGRVLNLKAKQ